MEDSDVDELGPAGYPRTASLLLSVAVPFGFIWSADHVRKTTAVNWVVALEGLVALSPAITNAVSSNRW